METTICLKSRNINDLIDYYLNALGIFKMQYESFDDEAYLFYSHDERVKLLLRKSIVRNTPLEIMLQVPNADCLFRNIKNQKLEKCGIIEGAYKIGEQEITFLTAPPGDYFHTKDPDGNKIIFFDKFEERT